MRFRILVLCAAVTIAATASAQTDSPITRENGYFVHSVTGEFPVLGAIHLRVTSRGPVTVRGDNGQRLRYTLRKRVRASSEEEARRVFALIQARMLRQGPIATLELGMPSRNLPLPEIEVAAPRQFRQCFVGTSGGALTFDNLDADIEAGTAGGRIHADRIGGTLIARTGGGDIRVGTVRGLLRCVTGGGPIYVKNAGAESWLDTAGGEIFVEEAAGPVHASTGAGNIDVGRAGASVSARSSGGFIRVMEAAGMVDVESAGGAIQVGAARGVRCESVGGGIRLHGVSGELNVSTAIGSILAELLRGIEKSYISTGSGDITIFIPSNVAVTVQAQNHSPGRIGRIVSDFPEVRVQPGASSTPGRIIAVGAINGGGPVLTIAASDGTIFLRRQK
jgi:DUF4097 and DUF4098 domain-containing protein YvlB